LSDNWIVFVPHKGDHAGCYLYVGSGGYPYSANFMIHARPAPTWQPPYRILTLPKQGASWPLPRVLVSIASEQSRDRKGAGYWVR